MTTITTVLFGAIIGAVSGTRVVALLLLLFLCARLSQPAASRWSEGSSRKEGREVCSVKGCYFIICATINVIDILTPKKKYSEEARS